MKRPGKRVIRVLLAVLFAPVLLWVCVVFLLPIWARSAVISALAKATRQDVRLDAVRIGFLGRVELEGLRFAAPATPTDPWLTAASIGVDVRLRDLIAGRVEPTFCRASGLEIRIRRDATGKLEFGDLLVRDHRHAGGEVAGPHRQNDHKLTITLKGATIHVQDEPTGARLEFTEVQGQAAFTSTSATLMELSGLLNGGKFKSSATLDRGNHKNLAVQIQARGVRLDVGTKPLALLVPLLATAGEQGNARAVLAIDADLRAQATSSEALGRTLAGSGRIALDDMALDDSRILRDVQAMLPVPTLGKIGSLRGQFTITDRRVTTGDTVLKVGEVPVNLSGWSDFDGRLDYLVKCEKLGNAVAKITGRLPTEARDLLAELPIDNLNTLAEVRVTGTIEHPNVLSAAAAIAPRRAAAKAPDRRSDKAKLREAGRRLLDRVIR